MTSLTQGVYTRKLSSTMQISSIGMFAAIAIILNRAFSVPAPFLNGILEYEIWEIPIVVAFILFGAKIAFPTATLNFFILLMFPNVILGGALYNLIAIVAMLLGVSLSLRLLRTNPIRATIAGIATSTVFGITLRVAIMTVVNAVFLQLPPPLGFSAPLSWVYASLPLIGFFNATLALYTIPAAFGIARAINFRRH